MWWLHVGAQNARKGACVPISGTASCSISGIVNTSNRDQHSATQIHRLKSNCGEHRRRRWQRERDDGGAGAGGGGGGGGGVVGEMVCVACADVMTNEQQPYSSAISHPIQQNESTVAFDGSKNRITISSCTEASKHSSFATCLLPSGELRRVVLNRKVVVQRAAVQL